MRNSKRNTTILSIATVALSVIAVATALPLALQNTTIRPFNVLENIIGDTDYAVGNNYGSIYSIDGIPIAEEISINDKEKYVAKTGYSEIVGSESGSLIYNCKSVLLSNNSPANRRMREGDSIITTLHSEGMRAAHNMLAEYDKSVDASICIVLRDGAVLVSAGNNSYDNSAFFDGEPPEKLYIDLNASDKEKGSSWKPLVYRMLLMHLDKLPDNMDFTSSGFIDWSSVSVQGNTINNWDYYFSENYDYDAGGLFHRRCSLAQLLEYSSNTAPVRLTQEIGFQKSFLYMNELYGLDKQLVTEINSLSSVNSSSERLPWFFFGQDASVSPIRMCQLYNFAMSGEFYVPFYTVAVREPDGKMIYNAQPHYKSEYNIDVSVEHDLLNNSLEDTFESYLTDRVRNEFSAELLESRRFLAKSGTAENSNGTENRTLTMTILSNDRKEVIGSACICVNNASWLITNDEFIIKLLNVLTACDML